MKPRQNTEHQERVLHGMICQKNRLLILSTVQNLLKNIRVTLPQNLTVISISAGGTNTKEFNERN